MTAKRQKTYINTNIAGQVIQIEHNLDGTPDIFFTELIGNTEFYISLLDPRIAEIKTLDKNRVQVTFANNFVGYVTLDIVHSDFPSDHERILELEEKYINQFNLIEDKVSKDQWTQMNNLFEANIKALNERIDSLESYVQVIKTELDAL